MMQYTLANRLTPNNSIRVEDSTTPITDIDEAKDYIGIYTQSTSDDTVIEMIVDSAIETVAKKLNEPLVIAEIADYYPTFHNKLVTTYDVPEGSSVKVEAIDEANTWQTIEGFVVDTTGKRTAVRFSPVPDLRLSTLIENPVRVIYTPNELPTNLIRNVVLELAKCFYQARSMEVEQRKITGILMRLDAIKRTREGLSVQ